MKEIGLKKHSWRLLIAAIIVVSFVNVSGVLFWPEKELVNQTSTSRSINWKVRFILARGVSPFESVNGVDAFSVAVAFNKTEFVRLYLDSSAKIDCDVLERNTMNRKYESDRIVLNERNTRCSN